MMLLDICFGSKSVWRVLMLYGESPGSGFTRQELREHTKLGNKALSFALKRLVTFGILSKNKDSFPLAVYKLNLGNKYSGDILKMIKSEKNELNSLPYGFGLIAREFSRRIIDIIDVKNIYLFGSVAKRTYREDSDMDFAVVLDKKNAKSDMLISKIAEELSRKFKRKIQYFILTEEQIKDSGKRSKLTEEILKDGIKII